MLSLDIFCPQLNHPVPAMADVQFSRWSERPHGSPQTVQAICEQVVALVFKHLSEHRDTEVVPI